MHPLNVSRSFVFQSAVPLKFWVHVVSTIAFLIKFPNFFFPKGKSLFEMIYNNSPHFENLSVIGKFTER